MHTMHSLYISFTDCLSIGAHIDYNEGNSRCIAIGTGDKTVNLRTGLVTACEELYGPDSSLIELPESDRDRWTYVTELLDRSVIS